jgi:hypothetical protein
VLLFLTGARFNLMKDLAVNPKMEDQKFEFNTCSPGCMLDDRMKVPTSRNTPRCRASDNLSDGVWYGTRRLSGSFIIMNYSICLVLSHCPILPFIGRFG